MATAVAVAVMAVVGMALHLEDMVGMTTVARLFRVLATLMVTATMTFSSVRMKMAMAAIAPVRPT